MVTYGQENCVKNDSKIKNGDILAICPLFNKHVRRIKSILILNSIILVISMVT